MIVELFIFHTNRFFVTLKNASMPLCQTYHVSIFDHMKINFSDLPVKLISTYKHYFITLIIVLILLYLFHVNALLRVTINSTIPIWYALVTFFNSCCSVLKKLAAGSVRPRCRAMSYALRM